ncbi:MAG: hypothetical protein QF351_06740, partial [Phycisphaerales bacterium]|nr:hypothetical protein [Phycisphaerales bacterium]
MNSRFAQTRHDSEHQIELCDNLSQSCDNTNRFFDKKEEKKKKKREVRKDDNNILYFLSFSFLFLSLFSSFLDLPFLS